MTSFTNRHQQTNFSPTRWIHLTLFAFILTGSSRSHDSSTSVEDRIAAALHLHEYNFQLWNFSCNSLNCVQYLESAPEVSWQSALVQMATSENSIKIYLTVANRDERCNDRILIANAKDKHWHLISSPNSSYNITERKFKYLLISLIVTFCVNLIGFSLIKDLFNGIVKPTHYATDIWSLIVRQTWSVDLDDHSAVDADSVGVRYWNLP